MSALHRFTDDASELPSSLLLPLNVGTCRLDSGDEPREDLLVEGEKEGGLCRAVLRVVGAVHLPGAGGES